MRRVMLWLLLMMVTLPAQAVPTAAAIAADTAALVASATERAEKAAADGRPDAALTHAIDALALNQLHAPAWRVILSLAKEDGDLLAARNYQAARTLWGPGGVEDSALRTPLAKDAALAKLMTARAAAVKELSELVKSLDKKAATSAATQVTVRHLHALVEELCGLNAGLRTLAATAFAPFPEHPALDLKQPLAALKECAEAALGAKDPGSALAMARLMQALATQARLQGLRGPKPEGMQPVGMAAANLIGRAREQLREKLTREMLALDALEALDPTARAQFTADHADSGNPGVTLSPAALYRVETTCGCDTLIGAAQTVELHHQRLAKWYGQDPFNGRQGTLRVVPTAAELEAEGTPHWWAGGFQGGDITTLRFSHGTIEGLGRGITHELTHRFDGAIYPGMPSWLVEGRAVWTGAAYGSSVDEEFVDKHVSVGTVEAAFIKGYGGRDNLKKLIEGTIEEYRDNYTAGYALFVYLSTAPPDGTPLHGAALDKFMRACATDRRPMLDRFLEAFCHPDSAGGLPKDLKEFAERFAEWLRGFYWQTRATWLDQYTTRINAPWNNAMVYDKPTWHKARDHAEPFFGQVHCATLGATLMSKSKPRDAALSLAAAALVDEPEADALRRAADALQAQGESGAAWALRATANRLFPDKAPRVASVAPLRGRIGKCIAYAAELATAAQSASATQPKLAALLHSDARRLAALLGEPESAGAPTNLPAGMPALQASATAPEDLPFSTGFAGYEETELSGFDEHRAPGLWTELPDGLIVGRKQERSGTGTTDRSAHQRDAFVRSKLAVAPGVWRFSCRVQALTSFISGAVVFGDTRRDRNARLRFSCGDFLYAIGRKEEQAKVESVSTSFVGLFEREGPLNSAVPGRQVKFPQPVADFRIELLVSGNCATAFVNGELVGSYTRPDGAPLEGHLGFASGQGAFRILEPRLQRMDSAVRANAETPVAYVDPAQTGTLGEPLNKPVNGLPRGQRGALVLWVPARANATPERPAIIDLSEMLTALESLARLHAASSLDIPLALAIPAACPEPMRAALTTAAAALPSKPTVLTHQWKRGLLLVPLPDGKEIPVVSLCWIDGNGILRSIDPFDGRVDQWPHGTARWMKGSGFTLLE